MKCCGMARCCLGKAVRLVQINALEESPMSISGLCSLTGSEFTRLAPTEQASAVARLSVFARVEPSHKSNLVMRLKEQAGSMLHSVLCHCIQKISEFQNFWTLMLVCSPFASCGPLKAR